ncbi:hypothetical protein CEXT_279461 [Caerostris extrusa]|uniref:Uncharacterized protein n=1 Tax=Caerostris extrusa TaxID=172846 RepID=A0AAV4QZ98_CAEEX|nr:hypothetical protein CEXT_279461 [Caerostris extrusa]
MDLCKKLSRWEAFMRSNRTSEENVQNLRIKVVQRMTFSKRKALFNHYSLKVGHLIYVLFLKSEVLLSQRRRKKNLRRMFEMDLCKKLSRLEEFMRPNRTSEGNERNFKNGKREEEQGFG